MEGRRRRDRRDTNSVQYARANCKIHIICVKEYLMVQLDKIDYVCF